MDSEFQDIKKFIVAAALFPEEIFYFFLLLSLYSVSKTSWMNSWATGEAVSRQRSWRNKKWMKWENQGPSVFEKGCRIGCGGSSWKAPEKGEQKGSKQ